ncbi:20393_t:CDS:10 [Cetraspora pellucida]|uniref:cellulase n=1 Tax=Cetraspora pellucida TaxID=1433469 RepID=A0A9N8VY14_9GLOM|nr:20393_t:CDS:10 [Cetraspora pellucida]
MEGYKIPGLPKIIPVVKHILKKSKIGSIKYSRWTPQEIATLLTAYKEHGKNWNLISQQYLPERPPATISRKYVHLEKIKARPTSEYNTWTPEDDETLRMATHKYGVGKWCEIRKKFFSDRSSAQVQERWNVLSKTKFGRWSPEEDKKLQELAKQYKEDYRVISEILKRPVHSVYVRYRRLQSPKWTIEELDKLRDLLKEYGKNWDKIEQMMPERNGWEIKKAADTLVCVNPFVNRRMWSKTEKGLIKEGVTICSCKDMNMTQLQYTLCFLTLVMICIIRVIPVVEAESSLGLNPSPDIPGIPKEGSDYSKLLAYSLYFYEAQRSGILPPNNRVSWRHNSAIDDGKDRGVNLTGGYYDAGDYVKFTLPLSWTLSIISWGAIEWFDGYRISNQTEYLYDMVKWGTDWLIAAHTKADQVFIQVGSSKLDNTYWGPDINIPYPRPSYDVNSTAHGTDIAAATAAAFASSAILFRDFFNDTTYAKTLISHAISIYDFAELQNFTLSTTSVPASLGYQTSSYYDKLVYGAIWLYRATYQPLYLTKAVNYYNQAKFTNSTRLMSWDDQTGACNILFAQTFYDKENAKTNLTLWANETERYLDGIMTYKNNCTHTNGGLLWCGDSPQASLPTALYGAFGFLMYSSYASTAEKANAYKNFVFSQIDYLFGNNPLKMFYVVAVHPNSPKNPHHAGASGGTNVGNLSDPVNTMYPLYGAIVGGPSQNDSYLDSRENIVQSEVALDYNSAYQGIMAYYVIDTYVPPPTSPQNPEVPTSILNSVSQQPKLLIIIVRDPEKNNQTIKSVDVEKDIKNIENEPSNHSEKGNQNNINELSMQFKKDSQDTISELSKQSEKGNQPFESEPSGQPEKDNQDSESKPLKQSEKDNQDSENEPSEQSEKNNQDFESESSKQSDKDNQDSKSEPSKQSEKDGSESEPSKHSEKDGSESEPSKRSEKVDSESESSKQSDKDDSESEPSKQTEKDNQDSENEPLKRFESANNSSNDTVVEIL